MVAILVGTLNNHRTCASCHQFIKLRYSSDLRVDAEGLVSLANDYKECGVRVVGISSNSVEVKPQDGPAEMAADAKEQGIYVCTTQAWKISYKQVEGKRKVMIVIAHLISLEIFLPGETCNPGLPSFPMRACALLRGDAKRLDME